MGHGIQAKDVVRYSSFVTEGNWSSEEDIWIFTEPDSWWADRQEASEEESDLDTIQGINALDKFNGWKLDSYTNRLGKKGHLSGWSWVKGERKVTFLNCSQYSNVGELELYLVCDSPEDAMAFYDDNPKVWGKQGFDLLEDEILMLWG